MHTANDLWYFMERPDGHDASVRWNGMHIFIECHDTARRYLHYLMGDYIAEKLFTQLFGEACVCMHGVTLQNPQAFLVSDIVQNRRFLDRETVVSSAKTFNAEYLPIIHRGTVGSAIEFLQSPHHSVYGNIPVKTLIGIPENTLYAQTEKRLILRLEMQQL